MAYDLKTKQTTADVDAFLESVADPRRRADAKALVELMGEVTGLPAALWGPSIVGFGGYRYTYASGHSGETCRVGFSPRKTSLVLYLDPDLLEGDPMMARLGKHKTGKSCLYVNRLADVDLAVLRQLIVRSLEALAARHG
jgi:hypothetical protein